MILLLLLLLKQKMDNFEYYNEYCDIAKKHKKTFILVDSLNGSEREKLWTLGYKLESVEPTHCKISWTN